MPNFYRVWLVLWCLLLPAARLRAQDCCATPACQMQARGYAQQVAGQLRPLGECPPNKDARLAGLARYRAQHPAAYARLDSLMRALKSWSAADNSRYLCFSQALTEVDVSPASLDDILNWSLHLAEDLSVPSQQSTEFCAGPAATIELNQGAADLFRSSESYFLSAKAYVLLKTFGASRGQCGGRVRLWLGGGLNYQDQNVMGIVAPKLEYRLRDLEAAGLAPVGHFKAILEPGYGFHPSTFQVLAGLGADVHLLQVQVLGGYQSRQNRYLFHLGLVYPLVGH